MSDKKIAIWEEGYIATGESAGAAFIGEFIGDTFDEAVESMLRARPDLRKHHRKSGDIHSIWACRLFDNEADARKSFG